MDAHEVAPGLFVGGWSAARDHRREFDVIVNCAIDAPNHGSTARFPLLDGPGNRRDIMERAVNYVRRAMRGKSRVLVHCVAGRSRSLTVVSAAISRETGEPLADVIARITKLRACEGPNQPHPALVALVKP